MITIGIYSILRFAIGGVFLLLITMLNRSAKFLAKDDDGPTLLFIIKIIFIQSI